MSVGREANLLALAKIRMVGLDGDGSASPHGPFFEIELTAANAGPRLILLVYLFFVRVFLRMIWCFY